MITLTAGHFQAADGSPLAHGNIAFQLNLDATIIAAPYGFIPASDIVVFQLDANGDIESGADIYSNAELNPQNASGLGTYYSVTVYDANNSRMNISPMFWQFTEAANSTVDISNMTAYFTGGNIIYYPIPSSSGSGTVTSVGFIDDTDIFSVTGSPITTSGSIILNFKNENANLFLAGPESGGAAPPTFRALVVADLPTSGIWNFTGTITNNVVPNSPFVTSANNDDFYADSVLSSQWTIIGTNSNYSYTIGNGRLTLKGNNSGSDNLYGIMEPISDTPPYTYATLMAFVTPYGDVPLVNGIAVGNSSGEYVVFGFDQITALDLVKFNSITSVAGSYGVMPNIGQSTAYLALQNDGTNLNCLVSFDGINYMTWISVTLASFIGTITQIGLAIDARTATASSYQWFRKIE